MMRQIIFNKILKNFYLGISDKHPHEKQRN